MKDKLQNDVQSFLEKLGLTKTEISLYVAGLQFGSLSATELAKRTSIKRTTVYSALDSLGQKGMVSTHIQTGATHYSMKDPGLIERNIMGKIEALKEQQLDFINVLPALEDISVKNLGVVETTTFTGVDGVKTALDTALFCAGRQWKIIAPTLNFLSESEKEYADYFIKIRKQRGIKAKSLWEPSFIKGRTFGETAFEFRDPRVLPKVLEGRFKSMVILFDSKVLFVNSVAVTSAVLIESSEIHDTIEVFFDGLWANASVIPKRNHRK